MLYVNRTRLFFAALLLAGASMSGAPRAWALEGILLKVPAQQDPYCHLKFPAIDEKSLGTNHPVLKDSGSGDIIDYYGPCDHDPLGKDEVQQQTADQQLREEREFSSE